ncbi:pyocin activator PrtN family protein [Pseudomonas sp. F1_0610]|uniref:pyocin activator PrtN family protein n=1 Tax=Pseudomonas sp. F1_0610 TaxID=3114284 RepID=UPI0039C264C4
MTTLEQLQKKYSCNFITLEHFREQFMPHIENQRHLILQLNEDAIRLPINKLNSSRKAPKIIYLRDLAKWLDQKEAAAYKAA